MATETRVVRDEIGESFEAIARHPDTVMLKYPGHRISHVPIHSKDYANCNGVALLNHTVVGLSHYDLHITAIPPETYLQQLIDEISEFANVSNLTAVPVGGASNHFERVKRILESNRIPIVGEYLDNWTESSQGTKITKGIKHLVVIPETLEVLMHSVPVRYVRLTP